MNRYKILIETQDQIGLIYKISKVMYDNQLNIDRNDEVVISESNTFFMRLEVSSKNDSAERLKSVKKELYHLLPIDTKIIISSFEKKKIVILVTKESHCLGDILIRYESGQLNAEIMAVIGNKEDLSHLCKKFDIPFLFISHENITREEHEELIAIEIRRLNPELIILAKFMRILTPGFVKEFYGKLINIHHSFLPSFIGQNPYKQAHARGVKIIGATAHYVNEKLDEGPIIAQDVIAVNHRQSWKDMQTSGRDIEKLVLSRALKMALEDRIFITGNKTVIFN